MRKLFWGCLAGGVAVAGGALGVMYHGFCHPDTLVGKCVTTASCLVSSGGAVPLVTEKVCTHSEGEAAEEGTDSHPAHIRACVSGEVILDEGTLEEAAQQPQSGVVGPETAPITIHEEEPAPTQLVPPEEGGATIDRGELPMNGGEAQAEVPGHCPQEMPYCMEQKKVPDQTDMVPQSEDDGCVEVLPAPCFGTGASEGSETTTFWQSILGMFQIEMPGWWSEPVEASVPMTESQPANHENDSPYHHSGSCPYSGYCPYTGRCAPMTPPAVEPPATTPAVEPPAAAPSTPPQMGGEEPSEDGNLTALRRALKLRHHFDGEKVEVAPEHPEVDTMEFRPSDANLYDYKLAGPL